MRRWRRRGCRVPDVVDRDESSVFVTKLASMFDLAEERLEAAATCRGRNVSRLSAGVWIRVYASPQPGGRSGGGLGSEEGSKVGCGRSMGPSDVGSALIGMDGVGWVG